MAPASVTVEATVGNKARQASIPFSSSPAIHYAPGAPGRAFSGRVSLNYGKHRVQHNFTCKYLKCWQNGKRWPGRGQTNLFAKTNRRDTHTHTPHTLIHTRHLSSVMYTCKCKYVDVFTEQPKEMFWEKKIAWIMRANTRMLLSARLRVCACVLGVYVITKHTTYKTWKCLHKYLLCVRLYCQRQRRPSTGRMSDFCFDSLTDHRINHKAEAA